MYKKLITLIVSCVIFSQAASSADGEVVIGRKSSISSDILGEERAYWVSLPDSYNRSSSYTDYPVIYLLDGEKLFHSATGAIKQMSTDATPQIPEMIVVGIVSQQRVRDSSPTNSLIGYEQKQDSSLAISGGADKFLAFISQELIPHIEEEYKVGPYRIFAGYSFTGLAVIHALYTIPSKFNAYIAIDPSLWWDDAVLLKQLDKEVEDVMPNNRVLFISTTERQPVSIWPNTNYVAEFIDKLQTKKIKELQFSYKKYGIEENHHTMPMISLYDGLNHIFDGYMLKQGIQYDEEPSDIETIFSSISSRLGANFLPPESVIDFYAGDLMYSDLHPNRDSAIKYFEMNARNYPASVRAWGRLGFAYAEVGEIELSISSLEQALMIDSNNEVIIKKLEELR